MTTFNASTAASSDDAMQSGSTVTLADFNLGLYWSDYWIGLRFLNVTIPAGAVISAATLTVTVVGTAGDDPDLRIYGQDADDAAAFTTTANDISGRPRTTAYTTWTATGIGAGSKTSPDFAAVIQEIIDRAGWASGNDIALILDSQSGALFDFRSWDYGSGTAPAISITYTAGSGQTVKAMYYAGRRK